jgi:hypothetical protein
MLMERVTRVRPSGEKTTNAQAGGRRAVGCIQTSRPVATAHSFTPEVVAVARVVLSGENARHETLLVLVPGDAGFGRGGRSRLLGQSHNLTRPSRDPDREKASPSPPAARILPSGAKARQEMCRRFALSVIGWEGPVWA